MQDVDAQGRMKKISQGPSSQGLTRLGSAPAKHMPQADRLNSSMTTSKGPTVMEVLVAIHISSSILLWCS